MRKTITLPNGKRKDFYGKTAAELDRKLKDARMQMGAGVDLSDNTTVGDFAALWFNVCRRNGLSENSQEAMKYRLHDRLLPSLENRKLRDVTPLHIQAALNTLSDKSAAVNRQALRDLRKMFASAVENGLILRNPVTASLTVTGTEAEGRGALSVAQEDALLAALDKDHTTWLFALLGLKTGMRRGEILGLAWDSIDLDARTLTVRRTVIFHPDGSPEVQEHTKTKAGMRTLPIPDSLWFALKNELRHDGYLLEKDGKPLGKSGITVITRKLKKAGEITPHWLRHTYITRLFDAGLDLTQVQYLAGHADPKITLSVYTHYLEGQRNEETFTQVREALA